MPIIYGSHEKTLPDRSDLSQYALWFDQHNYNFSLSFTYGMWRCSAFDRTTESFITGDLEEMPAKALHNCYTKIRRLSNAESH